MHDFLLSHSKGKVYIVTNVLHVPLSGEGKHNLNNAMKMKRMLFFLEKLYFYIIQVLFIYLEYNEKDCLFLH